MTFKSKPQNPFEQQRAAAKRKALRHLRKAKRAADVAGVKLSEWEGEFLGSVEERVTKYGRAFRDAEKGGPGTSLSLRQAVKLKEIASKASGREEGLEEAAFYEFLPRRARRIGADAGIPRHHTAGRDWLG